MSHDFFKPMLVVVIFPAALFQIPEPTGAASSGFNPYVGIGKTAASEKSPIHKWS